VLGSVPGSVSYALPLGSIVLTALVALAAGLGASIIPGKMAAKTSPVEALAAM
jgi:putative ABC transport system permease protein